MINPRSVLSLIQVRGGAVISGPGALIAARDTLRLAMDELGIVIVFDSGSAPDLVDALTITTVGALEGAALGAAVGLVVGLLAGNASAGAGVGAAVGGVAGAARGAARVGEGWRVRAVRDAAGTPVISFARGAT